MPRSSDPQGTAPHPQPAAGPLADALLRFAARYVWWKAPAEAVAEPRRVIAQVMNMGDQRDVEELARLAGDEVLREVVERAEAGQFGERSWAYWHYRLGLADVGRVPPLPTRSFS